MHKSIEILRLADKKRQSTESKLTGCAPCIWRDIIPFKCYVSKIKKDRINKELTSIRLTTMFTNT